MVTNSNFVPWPDEYPFTRFISGTSILVTQLYELWTPYEPNHTLRNDSTLPPAGYAFLFVQPNKFYRYKQIMSLCKFVPKIYKFENI